MTSRSISRRLAVLALLVALPLLSAPASAQTLTFSNISDKIVSLWQYDGNGEETWSKTLGNSYFGAELSATAGWWCDTSKRGIYGELRADAILPTGTVNRAAAVKAESYNTYTSGKSTFKAYLGGSVVYEDDWSADKSLSWSKSAEISKSWNFFVWVIPVTVKLSAGFEVEASLSLNVSLTGVGVSGKAGANAYGSASVGVGYSGSLGEASAGIKATLKLFDLGIESGAIVSITGVSGSMELYFNAVTIKVEVYVTIRALAWTVYENTWTIIEKSYGAFTYELFSF